MEKVRLYKGDALISENGIFGKDFKVTRERQSGEMYYRTKIGGTITFLKDDYNSIYGASLNDVFRIEFVSDNVVLAVATFYKVNCKFDTDNRICSIEPNFVDGYDRLLNGLNNKYNIVDLVAESDNVIGKKRAILQLYMLGDAKLTNVVGNMFYETDCAEILSASELTALPENNGYGFSRIALKGYVDITTTSPYASLVNGRYIAVHEPSNHRVKYTNEGSGAYFYATIVPGVQFPPIYNRQGVATQVVVASDGSITDAIPVVSDVRAGTVSIGTASTHDRSIYGRILTDSSLGSHLRRADDMSESNLNYRYVSPIFREIGGSRFVDSTLTQAEATKWGKADNGEYFVEPSTGSVDGTRRMIPIARGYWGGISYWFDCDIDTMDSLAQWDSEFICKDSYRIVSVLEKLLAKVDENIVGVESTFLTDRYNPMGFFEDFPTFYITPISNIKKTYYDQAAQRGDLSVSDILTLLKTLGLYWRLEDTIEGTIMRVEHYIYFYNGGDYDSYERSIALDITSLKEPRLGVSWSYGQNTISWNINKPKRTEFEWSSYLTEEFNGYPVEVIEDYMKDGGKTTISNGFIADIDLAVIRPGEVSDDGFAFFMAEYDDGYRIPCVTLNLGGEDMYPVSTFVTIQNGYLSFLWLEQNLLCYDMAGDNIKIGDYVTIAKSVARMKVQSVSVPCPLLIDEGGLVRTDVGVGEVAKMEYDITSKYAIFDLRLPTAD